MFCRRVRVRVSAFMDGELSVRRRQKVKRHLERCADCREYLGTMGEVTEILREALERPAPTGFALEVMVRARQAPEHRWFESVPWRWIWQPIRWLEAQPATVLAAALAVVALASFLGISMERALFTPPADQTAVTVPTDLGQLDWFGATPPGSLGRAYLATTSPPDASGGGK